MAPQSFGREIKISMCFNNSYRNFYGVYASDVAH